MSKNKKQSKIFVKLSSFHRHIDLHRSIRSVMAAFIVKLKIKLAVIIDIAVYSKYIVSTIGRFCCSRFAQLILLRSPTTPFGVWLVVCEIWVSLFSVPAAQSLQGNRRYSMFLHHTPSDQLQHRPFYPLFLLLT